MTNKTIGKYGEEIAKNFLIKKGFKILETNFHYSKMAEIDIIAQYKDVLHFVEVKTRSNKDFGSPMEAISQKKLISIFKCGMFYLKNCKKKYKRMQIDAIGIVLKNPVEIEFIENIEL